MEKELQSYLERIAVFDSQRFDAITSLLTELGIDYHTQEDEHEYKYPVYEKVPEKAPKEAASTRKSPRVGTAAFSTPRVFPKKGKKKNNELPENLIGVANKLGISVFRFAQAIKNVRWSLQENYCIEVMMEGCTENDFKETISASFFTETSERIDLSGDDLTDDDWDAIFTYILGENYRNLFGEEEEEWDENSLMKGIFDDEDEDEENTSSSAEEDFCDTEEELHQELGSVEEMDEELDFSCSPSGFEQISLFPDSKEDRLLESRYPTGGVMPRVYSEEEDDFMGNYYLNNLGINSGYYNSYGYGGYNGYGYGYQGRKFAGYKTVVEKTRNIVIPLSDYAEKDGKKIVLMAHYDAVGGSTGANDNGSAVAILIAFARRVIGNGSRLPFEIVFTDGEECGATGSSLYAERCKEDILEVINLDTCGVGEDIVVCDWSFHPSEITWNLIYHENLKHLRPVFVRSLPYCDADNMRSHGYNVTGICSLPRPDVKSIMTGKATYTETYKYMHNGEKDDIKYINYTVMRKIVEYLMLIL